MKHRAPFQAFQLAIWHAPRHILHLQHHVHYSGPTLFLYAADFDSTALKRPEARRPALQCFFCGLERKSTLQTYETRNFSLSTIRGHRRTGLEGVGYG